jgi:hypothetical protein
MITLKSNNVLAGLLALGCSTVKAEQITFVNPWAQAYTVRITPVARPAVQTERPIAAGESVTFSVDARYRYNIELVHDKLAYFRDAFDFSALRQQGHNGIVRLSDVFSMRGTYAEVQDARGRSRIQYFWVENPVDVPFSLESGQNGAVFTPTFPSLQLVFLPAPDSVPAWSQSGYGNSVLETKSRGSAPSRFGRRGRRR